LNPYHPHQTLTSILQFAKLPDLPDAHISVTNKIGTVVGKSLRLYISCRAHEGANGFGCLLEPITAQFFVIDPGNFYMDINAIQDGI
jgi:hypothetical protein